MLKRRHWGLLATAAVFVAGSAGAQTAQQTDLDTVKVEQMQRQMQALQDQMKQVNKELADAKKKAAEAKSEIPAAFNGAYGADLKPFPTKAPSIVDKVKLTWGGFLAAETVYRQHSTVNDLSTSFNAIPYPFAPTYGEPEFRASARQSRLSLLLEGALTPTQKLTGYYEFDFQGAAVNSNYNQSNSWAPRTRQLFFSYDNNEWGFHFLGGQAWSLLTQNTVGITPRKENVPVTIEPSYVAGFNYTRNWQLRVVQELSPWAAIGVSAEAPAALVFTGSGAIGNGGSANGWIVNFQNAGAGTLPSTGNFTADVAPDIIGKIALDPGWGHYEVFGIARFFNDNVFSCAAADIAANSTCTTTGTAAALVGATSQKTTVGDGVGGSVLLPLIPKYLDVQASGMYGRGIGRYGASQLSDVYVGSDGSLVPITAIHGLVGAVVHPWAGLDLYAYAGTEKEQSNVFSTLAGTGGLAGFGVPNLVNGGCYITTAASFTGGASNCAAVNKSVSSVTAGFWQDLYKGPMGRVAGGFEWEWVHREGFAAYGVPSPNPANLQPIGAVHTDDNIFLTSLRWYPF